LKIELNYINKGAFFIDWMGEKLGDLRFSQMKRETAILVNQILGDQTLKEDTSTNFKNHDEGENKTKSDLHKLHL
jgi:hypothetical protein